MLEHLSALVLAVVLITIAVPALAQPLMVVATETAVAPILDGKLDDAVWKKGEWYTDFTLLGEGLKRPEAQTRFQVALDGTNVYFAVSCLEPNMSRLVAFFTKRDDKLWWDDCVEIAVDPTGERTGYYHFIVNARGTVYDARSGPGGEGTAWDCNVQTATARNEEAWTVELAIPLVELGWTAGSRGEWALNVARVRRTGKEELSSFILTEGKGGLHRLAQFATLKLPGAGLDPDMWEVRKPSDVMLRRGKDGLIYGARIYIRNRTGRPGQVQLRPELIAGLQSTAGKRVNISLGPGEGQEVGFEVRVREPGAQTLRLRLVDQANREKVRYVAEMPILLEYTPLAIDITRPYYRDSIYATEQLEQIQFTVTTPSLSEAELAGMQLRATLWGDNRDTPPGLLAPPSMTVRAACEVKMTLPAKDLPVGDYELQVVLHDRAGARLYSTQKRLRKLPPAPNGHEWRVDENNVLLHNGEPFLPFGWFSFAVRDYDPANAYTALQSYTMELRPTRNVRPRLDSWAEKGLYGAFSPFCPEFKNRGKEVNQRLLNDEERELLRKRVEELMDHPAVLAWYLYDEPANKDTLPQRVEQIYEVIRDVDPYHPCIVLDNHISGIYKYAAGCDIKMPDTYPSFVPGGLARYPIERVARMMDAVKGATGGRKPAWVTPMAFCLRDPGVSGRIANLVELRNMMYQAVTHGARGFLWYTYAHEQFYTYPELNIGMPFLSREARDLKGAILAPDELEAVSFEAAQPGHIHAALRRAGGHVYLIVTSTATEPQEVTFKVKEVPDTLYVVSEGREVSLKGGQFTDIFDIYATHIYTTDAGLAERESLAATQARIAQANLPQKKPGNLASADSGVQVVVSSGECMEDRGHRPEPEPHAVVDGITSRMRWEASKSGPGEWLQLIWPEQIEFSRVVIYTHNIFGCQIQVPGGGEDEWVTVAEAEPSTKPLAPITATFDTVKANSLRILTTRLDVNWATAIIYEVEVYAE